ncbi:hypothetical protein [Phaeacidiphilus oryzae]|uniref:hypothetical protein n=1 Tax=Phaeacidiphilus oryzae TaxID=348818 RepID=UPI00056385E7|nr:hypothetical protein [Phaeacidiphilus oryzae]
MPATDSYGQNVQYLQLSDAPNLEQLGQWLTSGLVPQSIMRFESSTARAALLTGAQAPQAGMVTWLDSEQRIDYYDGAAWQAWTPGAWIPLTLSSGFAAFSGSPAYRILNQRVEMRGTIQKSDGTPFIKNSLFTFCTLPAAAVPNGYRYFTVATQWATDLYGRVEVHPAPDNFMQALIPQSTTTGAAWLSLDQVAYSLV